MCRVVAEPTGEFPKQICGSLFKVMAQLLNPYRKYVRAPNDVAASEQNCADRMEARIVEYDRLVSDSQSFWSAHQTAAISAPNVDVGDIVATLRYSKAHALNVQFGIAQGNVLEKSLVSGLLRAAHNGHRAMTCECCFPTRSSDDR